MTPGVTNTAEQRMYDALKRIARDYMSPDQIRRETKKDGELAYEEYLEMSYENIQTLAADTIRGMRRPKDRA